MLFSGFFKNRNMIFVIIKMLIIKNKNEVLVESTQQMHIVSTQQMFAVIDFYFTLPLG